MRARVLTPRRHLPYLLTTLLIAGVGQAGPSAAAPQQFGQPTVTTPAAIAGRTVSVQAVNEDVAALLTTIAADARANVVLMGEIKKTVTLTLHDAPFDQAVSLIAGAAGLNVQRVEGGYVISVRSQAIYRTRYIRTDRLVEALKTVFTPEQLRVISGPDQYYSPALPAAPPSASGGGSGSYGGGSSYSGGSSGFGSGSTPAAAAVPALPPAPPGAIRTILLIGEPAAVGRALALSRDMDRPRRQVRFSVKFTSFNYEWLREFGVQWSWAKLGLTEQARPTDATSDQRAVGSIGTFTRDPLFFEAAISAAEKNDNVVLKSIPSITVLDGESGRILVGAKHLFPKLVGYTQAQTPIYDKEQVDVGVSLDLGVSITDADDMVLTLLPQVSAIIGYLQTNESAYPQLSTLQQQTTIHVRDGETIVIGGLLSEESVDQVQGIPGLMKIPLLGRLFTHKTTTVRKRDLVILITAEIIKEPGQ